jgi:hypothetical protein
MKLIQVSNSRSNFYQSINRLKKLRYLDCRANQGGRHTASDFLQQHSYSTSDWYRQFLFRARAHVAAGSSPSLALPLKLDGGDSKALQATRERIRVLQQAGSLISIHSCHPPSHPPNQDGHSHNPLPNSAYLSPLKPCQWRKMPFLSAKSCCQYVKQYTGATTNNNSLCTSPIYPYSTWHCCRFASNNWHW